MQTHTTHTKKHRLLVAAPLFALFLVLSVRDGLVQSPLQASLTGSGSMVEAVNEAKILSLEGASYRLEAGARVVESAEGISLQAGTVLVFSEGLSRISTSRLTLEGWNGGYQVTVSGDTVTIATLSTPVLVSDGKNETLIPPFMQWKGRGFTSLTTGLDAWYASRKTLALPADFVQERMQTLSIIALQADAAEAYAADTILPPALGQELRFEAAQERAEQTIRLQRLEALHSALSSDASTVDTLLLEPDTAAILSSAEGQSAMPGLLTKALSTGKGGLFLSYFVVDSRQALLAAFHPLTRDHARVLPQTLAWTPDEELSFLLLTPLSDSAPDSLAPLAMEEWQARFSAFAQHGSGATVFADALPFLRAQIDRFDTLQYPARVDRYATALLAIAEPIETKLTADARHMLQDLRLLRTNRRIAAPIADVASSSSSVSSVAIAASSSSRHITLSNDELVADTQSLLQNAGFMFTSQTALKPVDGIVEVTNIVFGTAKGDIALRFSFDPTTQTVSGIEDNGQTLPYSVALQQFTEWIRTK